MSDNDERIAVLITKTDSMVDAVKDIAIGVSALLQFQASQTAKNEADKEWKQSVERHQEKQDERLDGSADDFKEWVKDEFVPVRDGQISNSRVTNWIGIVASLVIGALAMKFLGG